ncbi:Ig-like domain repeat protein [Terriglobus sp.]|uniref:Ig-like domain repeat protein n=1 Tax=Terriglobus sp. TaxID=1889013 RepID=UPI003B0018B6
MPAFAKSRAASRCGRLLALLLAALLLPACGAAAAACGQADPAELSEAARTILALNQNLFPVAQTAQITGSRGASRPGAGVSVSLLQSRAQLLREIMQTHPEEVRSVMLPASVADRLLAADPASAPYVERDAALTGDLAAIAVDDFAHDAGQRTYVLHDSSTSSQIAIHPAASFNLQPLLHRNVAIGGIQLGSDLLAETVTPASPAAIRLGAQHRLTLDAAAVAPASTSLTCSTTGPQRTAVLMMQFPNNTPAFPGGYGSAAWWQQAIAGTGNSVSSLWSEMTAGATYATADVYGPLTLARSYGCADYLQMRSAALTLASNTIDLSKYTRIVLGFPASSCTFGGLADIGCNGADSIVPHPYSVVWMPIVTSYTASTGVWASLAHELGHNLGLNHANTLDFGTVSLGPIDFQATNPGTVTGTGATIATGAITAVDTEYGDVFSVMGNPWLSGPGPYSAEHRVRLLDWMPASDTSSGLGTITAPGTYKIQPASTSTGLRALRVLRDATSASWLWLEYRNGGTPFDAANLAAVRGQNVAAGAVVHYENGYGDHDKTYQLDMTPTGKGNNFADGALLPGVTWSDPYSPLSLTVNNVTSAGLNVSVSYDSTCATFSFGGSAVSAAGGSGTVAVTAPPTCTWKASSNAAWMTLSQTTSGTGNGSFTWTAAANTGYSQRVTYLTVGRVSQRLLQLGSGANVLALSPANATVDPGSSIVLSLTLQNAGGIAGLQTVELDATAAGAPPCTVVADFSSGTPFFFALDSASNEFTSGLGAGSTGTIDTPGCTISGRGSSATASNGTITVALNLAFPAASPGVRALYATANAGTELPVGILNVGVVMASPSNPTTTNPPTPTLRPTTTTLTDPPASALPGTTLVFTATVAATNGNAVPGGTVTFLDGTTAIGSLPLDKTGKANLSTTTLSNGTHTITARYSGDATFAASASAAATVTVAQAATTTTLASSVTEVGAGAGATLTVTIGHTAAAIPGGTVTLRDGSTVLTAITLNHATASFPLNGIAAGTHTYTAVYGGDTVYLASTSDPLVLTAGKLPTTLAIASPPVTLAGTAIRIAVTANSPGTPTAQPAGTVLLQEGGRSVGSITLVNGTGTLALNLLSTGTHTLTASYGGDGNFNPAAAATITFDIVDFAITGPTGITVRAGALTANTATLTLTPGSNGFPMGVAFVCNGAPSGATCAVTPGMVVPGRNSVPLTVTVTTTAPSSTRTAALAGWLGLPLLGLLLSSRTKNPSLRLLSTLLATLALSAGVTGCGTGASAAATTTTAPPSSPIGTPAGNSTLTVQAIATSNGSTLTHTATVALQVN